MPAQRGRDVAKARQEVMRENRLARFWRETVAELRKVVWPTPNQAVNLTIVVIVTVVAMSVFLGAVDYILTQLVKLIVSH